MGAEVFEGLNENELTEQCEMRDMQRVRGESRRDLMGRMADYDATIRHGSRVAMYGLIDSRKAG